MTACSAHLRLSRCPLARYTLCANLHVIYVCMRALRRSRLTGALSVGADGPLFSPCSSLTVQSYVAWIEPSGTQVRLLHRMRVIAHAAFLCYARAGGLHWATLVASSGWRLVGMRRLLVVVAVHALHMWLVCLCRTPQSRARLLLHRVLQLRCIPRGGEEAKLEARRTRMSTAAC